MNMNMQEYLRPVIPENTEIVVMQKDLNTAQESLNTAVTELRESQARNVGKLDTIIDLLKP